MAVITKKAVTVCAHCESAIVENQRVWFKGSDLYCHSKCLIASFETVNRNKIEIAKQKRVDMMSDIFERRQKIRRELND